MRARSHRRPLALLAVALSVVLAACGTPSQPPAQSATLNIDITGLPNDTAAPVELRRPDGRSELIEFSTVRRELPTGVYQLSAFEQTDDPSVRYLPSASEAQLRLLTRDEYRVEIAYVPACDTSDRALREQCASLPWYPQGYILQDRELSVSATLQVLGTDGLGYESNEIRRVELSDRYFSMSLPRTLEPFQLDSISNVIAGFTFDQPTCDRTGITISDTRVRANDVFLDAYDPDPWGDLLDDEDEFSDPRVGEVFLFNRDDNQLVLWVYANGPVTVRGSETCSAAADFEGGTLTFDLKLEYGWNLVAFDFADPGTADLGVTVRRIDGPSGRAFGLMPADFGATEDPNDPIPSVQPRDVDPLAPQGFLNVPRDGFGRFVDPWSRPLSIAASASGAVENADQEFAEAIVELTDRETVDRSNSFRFDLDLTDAADLLDEWRMLPFPVTVFSVNNEDPDYKPRDLCDAPLEPTGAANPRYLTASFDVFAPSDRGVPVYRANATLMYDSTVAAWWYVPEAFSVQGSQGRQNCELTPGTLTEFTYDLDLVPGWNVVYTVIDARSTNPDDPDAQLVFQTLVTNDPEQLEVPFLYWRANPDTRLDRSEPEVGAPDRGSLPDADGLLTIHGAFTSCAADETCALNALLDNDADMVALTTALRDPFDARTSVTSSTFTLAMPDAIDFGAAGSFQENGDLYTVERFLPDSDLYDAGPDGDDGLRPCLPEDADAGLRVARLTLDLQTQVDGEDVVMGEAALRSARNDLLVTRNVEWVYANQAAALVWDANCFLTERERDESEITEFRRPVNFDIALDLEAGWNAYVRVNEIDQRTGAQTITWRTLDAFGEYEDADGNVVDAMRQVAWFADLTNPDPRAGADDAEATAARALGLDRASWDAARSAASEPAARPARSILRGFAEGAW